MNLFIEKNNDISNEVLEYLIKESQRVATHSLENINEYIDIEVFNPEVGTILNQQEILDFIEDSIDPPELALASMTMHGTAIKMHNLSLGYENELSLAKVGLPKVKRFKKLKHKIRKIFCKVIAEMELNTEPKLKEILQAVITALLGALGGIAGVLVSIVIGIAAKLIKKGISNICPI